MYCANVDTFGKSKTGEWYAEEIKKIIERTGNSVPLVLLDSAGECDKARKILRKWCKTLTAGACATHTLDLLFDDICKLDRFKKMLGTARVITKVVRNHTKLHAHYVENGGTAIDKWSDTRQVAAMYMVLSLKRNMPKLVALVLSDVFKKWGQSKHKRKTTDYDPMQGTAGQGKTNEQLAGIVQKAVQSTEFWQEVDIFVTVLQKIYATLRANDSEVPGTPDIYFRMSCHASMQSCHASSVRLPSAPCQCQPRSAPRSACGRCLRGFKARSATVSNKREPRNWRTCTGRCATIHGRLIRATRR